MQNLSTNQGLGVAPAGQAGAPVPEKLQVVIVDDNPVNLLLLKKLVLGLGTGEPVCFEDPQEALEHCLENPPAVVVTDYMMPGMDGLELMEKFKQVPELKNTLVLMVTAVEDKELLKDALKAGVTDFLTKPVDGVEFRLRLRTLLRLAAALNADGTNATKATIEHSQTMAKLRAQEADLISCLSRIANYRTGRGEVRAERVARYVARIAREVGLPEAECEHMYQAAMLYDIGQIGVSDSILNKSERLSAEEFSLVKEHSEIGFQILQSASSPLLQEAARMARSHHEAFDGGGYPDGLLGSAIPLCARIVAVADVYDALISQRPHREAWPLDKAVNHIRENSGTRFDPEIVGAFERSLVDLLSIKGELERAAK
jgi:response regulator RpfG family c-di-GMP phosphodiesterase